MRNRAAQIGVGRPHVSDYWRAPGYSERRAGPRPFGHKEWHHFCVFGRGLHLLLNWSAMTGVQTIGSRELVPRIAVLVRDDRGWHGAVERFGPEESQISGGDAHFGRNRLCIAERGYAAEVDLPASGIRASLRFEPLARPVLTNTMALAWGGRVRWLIVPRLRAEGFVEVDGSRTPICGEPAYHDHNWGDFRWGEDFSWEWGIALPRTPETPWAVVVTRLCDRARLRSFADTLLLWKERALIRSFRNAELHAEREGLLRVTPRPLRIPPVMSLAAPGVGADVPTRYTVRAAGGGDVIEVEIRPIDFAQIGIPDDHGRNGISLLSEVRAEARVSGRVRGEHVGFEGPALLEMTHAA